MRGSKERERKREREREREDDKRQRPCRAQQYAARPQSAEEGFCNRE